MDWTIVLSGIGLGFAIAAPVGPIGILCIRRTLSDGRLVGFVSGLGAATADALYGAVAASGVAITATLAASTTAWLRIAGALFLCWLGITTVRAPLPSSNKAHRERATGIVGAFGSTLLLTLSNPLTIISFAGVFAGLGAGSGDYGVSLVLGVFAGSALWWLVLSTVAGMLRRRLSPGVLVWVNRLAGVLILLFALLALLSIVVGGA